MDGKVKFYVYALVFVFLFSFSSIQADSPNLINGNPNLPSLDVASLSNNTYNINYTVAGEPRWDANYSNFLLRVSGVGTYGYIPMWNGTSSLNNSNIFQLGDNVGIGTTTPVSALEVNGTITIPYTGTNTIRLMDSVGDDYMDMYANGDNAFLFQMGGTSLVGILIFEDLVTETRRTTAGVVSRIRSNGVAGWIEYNENGAIRGYEGFGDAGSIFTSATTNSISLRSEADLFLGAGGDDIFIVLNATTNKIEAQKGVSVIGDINITGCYTLSNGTIIGGSCVSDVSTKENIKNYTTNLNNLLSLSPKEFEYKDTHLFVTNKTRTALVSTLTGYEERTFINDTTNETYILSEPIYELIPKIITESIYYDLPDGIQKGFVADEVEQLYPDFVETDEYGFKRIKYGMNWVFELWKQNQEQQKQINQMNSTLNKICTKQPTLCQ